MELIISFILMTDSRCSMVKCADLFCQVGYAPRRSHQGYVQVVSPKKIWDEFGEDWKRVEFALPREHFCRRYQLFANSKSRHFCRNI